MKAYILLFVLGFSMVAFTFPIVTLRRSTGLTTRPRLPFRLHHQRLKALLPSQGPQSKQRRTAKILRVSRAIYIYSQYSDNLWSDRLSHAHNLPSLFKPLATEGSDMSHGKSYKRSWADNLGWCDEHPWLYPDGYTGPIQGP